MKSFNLLQDATTQYLFYTGKGGVGKTSIACATAVAMADAGKKVLLISTDPASNLQDVFDTPLTGSGVPLENLPNLVVANLDPIQAAAEYKESVIAPYRGKLPESVLTNMEEQLSGSCTVEIAAFNEFSKFITDPAVAQTYDHILFDTAPTGHTLRMLQLPSAWSNFISENTHGASCLGQLSGLEDKKDMYKQAVQTLSDAARTTLVLVSRPEVSPLKEAARASGELAELGVKNQLLVINGVFSSEEAFTDPPEEKQFACCAQPSPLPLNDPLARALHEKQQDALKELPDALHHLPARMVPLRPYNLTGIAALRALLSGTELSIEAPAYQPPSLFHLKDVIHDLAASNKKVVFTMGKGGVGKTTIAAAIALGLAAMGKDVHLATTDPAAHLQFVLDESTHISTSHIDEAEELKKYSQEVLSKARETMDDADIAYIEEDLRSPCTQEIAVFRRFAQIVEQADQHVVVIDTAPTGHTLLLLDATQSYHREVQRTQGSIPDAVKKLLPRLRSQETAVVLVTLAEATPVYEALRLEEDLHRAGIATKWWAVNASLHMADTADALLAAKAQGELRWLNEVARHADGNVAVIPWRSDEVKGAALLELAQE